jgi:hypothetical protein
MHSINLLVGGIPVIRTGAEKLVTLTTSLDLHFVSRTLKKFKLVPFVVNKNSK